MARYIDAEKLLNELQKRYKSALSGYESVSVSELKIRAEQAVASFLESILTIKNQAAADVQEMKHGHWIVVEYEYLICSHCGASYYMGYTGAKSIEIAKEYLDNNCAYKYCPDCGAKMDEKR